MVTENSSSDAEAVDSSRDSFRSNILRSIIAQQCLTIGWHGITESSLAALTDVLDRYLKNISSKISGYTDLASRNEATVDDFRLSLHDVEPAATLKDLRSFCSDLKATPLEVDIEVSAPVESDLVKYENGYAKLDGSVRGPGGEPSGSFAGQNEVTNAVDGTNHQRPEWMDEDLIFPPISYLSLGKDIEKVPLKNEEQRFPAVVADIVIADEDEDISRSPPLPNLTPAQSRASPFKPAAAPTTALPRQLKSVSLVNGKIVCPQECRVPLARLPLPAVPVKVSRASPINLPIEKRKRIKKELGVEILHPLMESTIKALQRKEKEKSNDRDVDASTKSQRSVVSLPSPVSGLLAEPQRPLDDLKIRIKPFKPKSLKVCKKPPEAGKASDLPSCTPYQPEKVLTVPTVVAKPATPSPPKEVGSPAPPPNLPPPPVVDVTGESRKKVTLTLRAIPPLSHHTKDRKKAEVRINGSNHMAYSVGSDDKSEKGHKRKREHEEILLLDESNGRSQHKRRKDGEKTDGHSLGDDIEKRKPTKLADSIDKLIEKQKKQAVEPVYDFYREKPSAHLSSSVSISASQNQSHTIDKNSGKKDHRFNEVEKRHGRPDSFPDSLKERAAVSVPTVSDRRTKEVETRQGAYGGKSWTQEFDTSMNHGNPVVGREKIKSKAIFDPETPIISKQTAVTDSKPRNAADPPFGHPPIPKIMFRRAGNDVQVVKPFPVTSAASSRPAPSNPSSRYVPPSLSFEQISAAHPLNLSLPIPFTPAATLSYTSTAPLDLSMKSPAKAAVARTPVPAPSPVTSVSKASETTQATTIPNHNSRLLIPLKNTGKSVTQPVLLSDTQKTPVRKATKPQVPPPPPAVVHRPPVPVKRKQDLDKMPGATASLPAAPPSRPPPPAPSPVLPPPVPVFLPAVRTEGSQEKVWICPSCGKPDDGSPMVGCDECDDWFHWTCVGLLAEPTVEKWFCPKCLGRKSGKSKKGKKGR